MNLNYKKILRGIFWLVCVLCMAETHAQKQPVVTATPLIGDSVKVGKKMEVQDSIYFTHADSVRIARTNSVDNIVSLYINEFTGKVFPDTFHVTVRLQVNYVTASGSGSRLDTLQILYSKNHPYNSKAIKFYKNYYSLEAIITGMDITGVAAADTAAVRKLLVMENMIAIDRNFTTLCTTVESVSKDTAGFAATGELKVTWEAQEFIPAYDLEWTFIDSAAIASGNYSPLGPSFLDPYLIFKNNFTRVITSGSSYKIPLLYDGAGALFFRVRTVQYAPDGEVIHGEWSAGTSNLGRYDFRGHERNLNWQATTSFAEEGKRKSVVQYFDGSLKGRQTVTKDNTTNTTVVAETLYDKQGRPVIQVLPAPTLSSLIAYSRKFNVKAFDSTEYDKSVYDTLRDEEDYCSIVADSMSVINGASRYYSPLNSLSSTSYHQYIPDAKKFAFAETRYTRDNTGRIDRQGGVGDSMQIGGGHETRYFYGSAEQKELDALFGTEAGDAAHYEKNMVRDANGQYSVSYVDMHGRTVATALAGDASPKQEQLASYNSVEQTDQLLTTTNNIIKDNTIQSTKSILVPKTGLYTFNYTVKPESVSLMDCNNDSVCYDCLYDLTITISNDCDGPVKVITRRNFSLYKEDGVTHNIDTTCAVADSFHVTETITLEEGNYDVTKVLSLSKEGMQYYRDSLYLPHNTCKTFAQLLTEQLDSIRQRMTCAPDSAVTNLVTAYRDQMLIDLTPLIGQYADTALGRSCFSIFDKVGDDYLYQTIDGTYENEDGLAQKVSHYDGTDWVLVSPKQLSPEEFIANFQDRWAETLLPRHPEYNLLLEYEKLKSAYAWEADFLTTETYAEALAKGYLNPLASTNAPANRFTVSGKIDSLFVDLPTGDLAAAKAAIENSMLNYKLQTSTGGYFNIWGLSTGVVKCNPGDSLCFVYWNQTANSFDTDSMCTGDLDQAWRLFRAQYLQIREDWIDNYTRTKSGIYSNMFDNICTAVFPDHNFSTATQYDLYGGYTGTAADSTTGLNNLDSYFLDNCRAYATKWWQDLAPCGYNSTDSAAIIPLLIQVCHEGADINHPFGASTVKPSSTNTYRSFEEVIIAYNNANYTDPVKDPLACNAYLIPNPKPYDQPGMIVNLPIIAAPDSCTCSKINDFYFQYVTDSSIYHTFSNYLQTVHGTRISQGALDTLRNLCAGDTACRYLVKPILLPPALQCNSGSACADCEEVRALYDSFAVKFPGAIPTKIDYDSTRQINTIFANFMNHHLGFSKQAYEYLVFLDSCPPAESIECDSTYWVVFNPGTNLAINADLYANAVNNIPPYSQFFSGGYFNSPTTGQASHYVLVNKRDSMAVSTTTLVMQWRVKPGSDSYMADPFIRRGTNTTYVGAQWIRDPSDTSWWIGATTLKGEDGNTIKGIGLGSNSHGLKADWVKIINPSTGALLYFHDFTTAGSCTSQGPFLCGQQAADSSMILHMNECEDTTLFATQNATYMLTLYKQKLKGNFEKAYSKKCMDAGKLESFTVTHAMAEYHYTLYYYDQAGNLVKTVPPEGVFVARRTPWLDSVAIARAGNVPLPAKHNDSLTTTYRYNSLNQVITQHSPDGGLSKFFYDRLGRLVVSQNAKQLADDNNYSYTLYDKLGRITEVGQKKQVTGITNAITRNQSSLNSWLSYTYTLNSQTVIAEQVTSTVYDIPDALVKAALNGSGYIVNETFQKNYTLRNRVSFTRYYDLLKWNGSEKVVTDYDNSSTYSYDIHGNVDTLLHDYKVGIMQENGLNRYKAMAYKYDLISGKVNEVHYQPGRTDQLFHRYEYDAENRLTDVYTTDSKQLLGIPVLEEHEARYSYYRHGPLARTVLGQQQVQGIDYAYTLQGWLKGVNNDSLLDEDGAVTAKDAYRFSLNYFNNDYKAIGASVQTAFPGHSAYMETAHTGDYKPLYNGNISSMVVGIVKLGETKLYNYGYDQLNRLVKMDTWNGFSDGTTNPWSGITRTDAYKERIAYDANGNILKYLRNGRSGKLDMDSLTYNYNRDGNGNLTNNKLRHVRDAVSDGTYTANTDGVEDIDSQAADNYEYDEIGNLTKDVKEGISSIEWTLYGKIRSISKTDGTVINYTYDVSGNRISKAVTKEGNINTTWYARDAQGTPMAIYSGTSSALTLNEHHLYGSNRLGVWNRSIDMNASANVNNGIFERGNKFFELSNHLGNVLTTISDKKSGHDGGGGVVDYYTSDVVNANDYYPFGMMMPGRKYSAGSLYRYGFNGKENDSDAKGEGNQQDYGMRIYDPRVGRFLSTDPITKNYPELTPYQFASNSPIQGVDQDGLELERILLKIGMKSISVLDQRADQIKEKKFQNPGYNYSASEKFALFANGLAKSTPFGAAHQIDKQLDIYRNATPEQKAQMKQQQGEHLVHLTKSVGRDFLSGNAPGTSAIAESLAPTVNAAIKGDPEAIGELTGLFFQAAGPKFFGGVTSEIGGISNLSRLEQNIVSEANAVFNSDKFAVIKNAYEKGIRVEVKINKGTIIYDPEYSYSAAMTLQGEGFLLGPQAFTAKGGVSQTVLWEITRLKTQKIGELAVDQTRPFTQNAEQTSAKLLPYVKKNE